MGAENPKLTTAAIVAALKEPLPLISANSSGTLKGKRYTLRLLGRSYRQWVGAVGGFTSGFIANTYHAGGRAVQKTVEEIAAEVDAWSRRKNEADEKYRRQQEERRAASNAFAAERDAWATASGARELAPLGRVGLISVTVEGVNKMSISTSDSTNLTLEEVKKYLRETRDALNALGTRLEPNT